MKIRKFFRVVLGVLVALTTGIMSARAETPASPNKSDHCGNNLFPPLQKYVAEVVGELGDLSPERKQVLGAIADDVVMQLEAGKPAQLTFICTHNSRRSHMSQ